MSKFDKELEKYKRAIGLEEFTRQYHALYDYPRKHKNRHSGLNYEVSPERLEKIREKYKNGVPKGIVEDMVRHFCIIFI